MERGADLEKARAELDAADSRLQRLKRAIVAPVEPSPRARRWSVVRRMVDGLRETLSTWLEAAPLVGEAPPETLSRRAEVEATIGRAQEALSEVERQRRLLDERQGRALAQLELAADAWTRLYRELPTAAPVLDESSLAVVLGRFQRLLVESERALDEERQAHGDAQAAVVAWRWLVDVTYPVFEQRAAPADETLLLPTLRRLVEELDGRWAAELRRAASGAAAPTAGPAKELSQEMARRAGEEGQARDAIFERAAAAWVAQIESLVRAVEQARTRVDEERARGEAAAASARQEAEFWQKNALEARAEIERHDEQLAKEKARVAALEKAMRFMTARTSRLRDAVLAAAAMRDVAEAASSTAYNAADALVRSVHEAADEAAQKLAAAASQASQQLGAQADRQAAELAKVARDAAAAAAAFERAAAQKAAAEKAAVEQAAAEKAAGERAAAGSDDTLAAPSLEPVLDPAWNRLLQVVSEPLGAAGAQLRRLYAARMPDPYRAVVRATAGYVAQASDVSRVVREYLDETPVEDAKGRLDAAVDGALAVWETALARRGIRIERSIGRDLPQVRAKTETLRLAVYQLVRNAWEALPRGGVLTIRVWRDAATGEARASFADSGAGFTAEARAKAFEPFASAKPGHVGLGLALSRRVARRAGGDLELEVKAGGGAALLLRLPPLDEAPAAPPA